MMNYAETTSISTIVPLTQSSSNQDQEHRSEGVRSMLSTLFVHPEFLQGVRDCQNYYFDCYGEAPLTEEEMVEEVEMNLSRETIAGDKQAAAGLGDQAPSYLEKLGWVMGTIAKGLTYTDRQNQGTTQ